MVTAGGICDGVVLAVATPTLRCALFTVRVMPIVGWTKFDVWTIALSKTNVRAAAGLSSVRFVSSALALLIQALRRRKPKPAARYMLGTISDVGVRLVEKLEVYP